MKIVVKTGTTTQTRYIADTITTQGSFGITSSEGVDTILDFNATQGDRIKLNGFSGLDSDLSMSGVQLDAATLVALGSVFDVTYGDYDNGAGTTDTRLSWSGGSITVLNSIIGSGTAHDVSSFLTDTDVLPA